MKFYDDATGTGRGVISHPTALHFALTQTVYPSSSIIMTMTQNTGVVVNGIFLHKKYNKSDADSGLDVKKRRKAGGDLPANVYRYENRGEFSDSRKHQRQYKNRWAR